MQCCVVMMIWPLLIASPVQTDAPKKVAGRTLAEFTKDLESPNLFIRLHAAKSLRAFGKPATVALTKALRDKHPGVQYWAASHLGDLGSASKEAISLLRKIETGKNPATAMAAAYALCRAEKPKDHIKLLIARLEYPQRGMACCAAELLGRLGEDARSAVPALEAAYHRNDKKPGEKNRGNADYHIRGASQNALRLILGEWKAKK